MKTWLTYNWLRLLALTMALGAVYSEFPYVYYQLTSWVILGAALIAVQQAHGNDRTFLVWLFLATAVVFNPFTPLSIDEVAVWQVLYLVGALIFFSSFFLLKRAK